MSQAINTSQFPNPPSQQSSAQMLKVELAQTALTQGKISAAIFKAIPKEMLQLVTGLEALALYKKQPSLTADELVRCADDCASGKAKLEKVDALIKILNKPHFGARKSIDSTDASYATDAAQDNWATCFGKLYEGKYINSNGTYGTLNLGYLKNFSAKKIGAISMALEDLAPYNFGPQDLSALSAEVIKAINSRNAHALYEKTSVTPADLAAFDAAKIKAITQAAMLSLYNKEHIDASKHTYTISIEAVMKMSTEDIKQFTDFDNLLKVHNQQITCDLLAKVGLHHDNDSATDDSGISAASSEVHSLGECDSAIGSGVLLP